MSDSIICRFTDRIEGDTLLDLNDLSTYWLLDDSEFPLPEVVYSWVENSEGRRLAGWHLLGDNIKLVLLIHGTSEDDAYTNLRVLLKRLLKENTLEVRPYGATGSVFYHTYPALPILPQWNMKAAIEEGYITNVTIEIPVDEKVRIARESLTILENLAPNPSFENGNIDDWTITVGAGSSVAQSATEKHDGSFSAKFIKAGGTDCYMTITGFITIDILDPYYLDGLLYSTAALEFTMEALCYDSVDAYIDTVPFTGDTRGGTEFDRQVMYLYHHGDITKYYIAATDWPALTAKIRIRASLNDNGTVYLDSLTFANVKYISDYAVDGVVGLRIPPGETKGDLPALCDFYISNPFTSPPWKEQESGTSLELYSVSALDSSHVWAVGNIGKILFFDGVSWAVQPLVTAQKLNSVSALDSSHVWVVGNSGKILFFDGVSWAVQTSGTYDEYYGVFALDTTHIWAVGEDGTILFSADAGVTWTPQTSGTSKDLRSVHAFDAIHIIAVGDDGIIITSANAGATWTVRTSGTTKDLYGVYILDATHAWAVGQDGTVLFSADAGVTWTPQTSGTTEDLHSVYAFDSTHVWTSGDYRMILFFNGINWTLQLSGMGEDLYGIDGLSATSVWVVGSIGIILYGIYSPGALAITDLILGQRDGYDANYNPVVETPSLDTLGGAVTLVYSPYRRWGTYRILAAGKMVDFLYNLAAHAGSQYMVTAGISFSSPTAFDKGTIHLLLQTTAGTAITAQYIEDEVDLGDPNTKWKEVVLQALRWGRIRSPTYKVSGEAELGNINQVVELIADASLAGVTLWLDYVAVIPTYRFVNIGTITANYLIIDSTLSYVLDSIDGGPSTAMIHNSSEVNGVPGFLANPDGGMNLTLLAINEVYSDQRIGMVNLRMEYYPCYLLVKSTEPIEE
jgi:photosystem II stability/assembly factor-like uncharacterized protein